MLKSLRARLTKICSHCGWQAIAYPATTVCPVCTNPVSTVDV